MQKTRLLEDLFIYTTTGTEEINIVVLINNDNALLIDTGYPEIAKEISAQLATDELNPEIIINSHYHPDHINGNYLFKKSTFMGCELYKQNYELFEALNPEIEYIKPTILLKDGQVFNYGPFELNFYNLKGHCQDCLVTIIKHPELSDPLIHVADLLMFSNDGKHSIPYISYDGSIEEHIQSLKNLQAMNIGILLPSHGIMLEDTPAIEEAIQMRIHYLERLRELGKLAKVEDCLLGEHHRYNLLRLHEQNIQNVFG